MLLDLQALLIHMDGEEFLYFQESIGDGHNPMNKNFENVELWKSFRQYLGSTSNKGNLLFINGACRTNDLDITKEWIQFHDGGLCFWQALINMDKKKIMFVHVNGH